MLDEIVRRTARRIPHLPTLGGRDPRKSRRSLEGAIRACSDRHAIIAEIKFASPSAGTIRPHSPVPGLARMLQEGGCAALSVITEPDFFGGEAHYLPAARQAVSVPVLRKDFIIDARQLYETQAIQADAVLLIAGLLQDRLPAFVALCGKLGLEPLVEVGSERDAAYAIESGATIIGINNRDLVTMTTDPRRTIELSGMIRDAGRLVVAESGVRGPDEIRLLAPYADAFLVGTAVMRSANPKNMLEGLVFA
jgi:indole-3-glycerol phosphate synthase